MDVCYVDSAREEVCESVNHEQDLSEHSWSFILNERKDGKGNKCFYEAGNRFLL